MQEYYIHVLILTIRALKIKKSMKKIFFFKLRHKLQDSYYERAMKRFQSASVSKKK